MQPSKRTEPIRLLDVNGLIALIESHLHQEAALRWLAFLPLRSARIGTTRTFGHKQVTEFHLINLAASSNAVLATFDRRIAEALAPEDRAYVEIIPVRGDQVTPRR